MSFNRKDIQEYPDILDNDEFQLDNDDYEEDLQVEASIQENYMADTVLEIYESISGYIRNTGAPLCERLSVNMISKFTEKLIG
jgi:hypothetical protein